MSLPVTVQIILGFLFFTAIFVPLERLVPARPQAALRSGWSLDLFYYGLGCALGRFSDATCIAAALLLRPLFGLAPGLAATQPGWLQFLEILLIADFTSYFFHRALHRNAWLWRFHKVHHTSQRMDWLAGSRLHPVDKVLGDICQFLPVFVMGFGDHPVLAYALFLGLQNFLCHANCRFDFGPLRWILVTPQFHHWHHCDDASMHDRNYGLNLVLLDLLLGTAHFPPRRELPRRYGIAEAAPEGFWAQLAWPFRRASPGGASTSNS
jgi:lathosterol oxidase